MKKEKPRLQILPLCAFQRAIHCDQFLSASHQRAPGRRNALLRALPLRRRAPTARRERLVASVPHVHWKTLTLVAALRITGLTAPYVIEGAMDGPVENLMAPA
jgi:hypothetical protein